MAVYFIYPQKDATIYSEENSMNTGLSEILDLSKSSSPTYPLYSAVGRALIQFDNTDINNTLNRYIGTSSYSASLRLFLANASAIPLNYDLQVYAISGAWDMGTGRITDEPIVSNGVTWKYSTANGNAWQNAAFAAGVTASFFTGSNPGGGVWYVNTLSTQSFDYRSSLDTCFDVTSTVKQFVSGTIVNNGFIIKNDSSIEFNPSYQYKLTYFSIDTNTIYPPLLELKWDDSVYVPNTSSMSMISGNSVITLGNNPGVFVPDSRVRINVNARDQYPARVFVTSSLFTINQFLPTSSFYSLVDIQTNNIIFDFDDNFTKISTDQNGSFFLMYMNGLEPERYYKLRIKVVSGPVVNIYDDNYYFKIEKR